MLYDLHIHSALSPCADNNMTPAAIMGMMSLAGADVVTISDHNSALNLPAAQKAADFYNLKLLPCIEVNTAEEIHILSYFRRIEDALKMGELIYDSLPDVAVDSLIWGEELVMDEEDVVLMKVGKLLALASGYDIYEIVRMTEEFGGMAVPAHVDRESNSLLSVMGFMPSDLEFRVVEMTDPSRYEDYIQKKLLPEGLKIITSSDSHCMQQLVRDTLPTLEADNPLTELIYSL